MQISKDKRIYLFFLALALPALLTLTPVFGLGIKLFHNLAMSMVQEVAKGAYDSDVVGWFTSNIYDGSNKFNAGWSVIEAVFSVIQPVAVTMVGMAFAIKVAKMSTDIEHINYERFLQPLLEAAACSFIAGHAGRLLAIILRAGVVFSDNVRAATNSMLNATIPDTVTKVLDTHWWDVLGIADFWVGLQAVVAMAIPYILVKIAKILIKVSVIGVMIEILVRCCLFPLSLGDIMLHGYNGRGFASIKKFAGSVCQGGTVIMILAIQNSLIIKELQAAGTSGDSSLLFIVDDFAKAGITIAIYSLAAFGLIQKAGELTREALGA